MPRALPIRVVIVTMYESALETGDHFVEFRLWAERMPLNERIPFPYGFRYLRYNSDKGVIGLVSGVGTARAVRIYKTYGPDAVQVMTENPYRLARDIRGIGFKTADAIAVKLGIEKTAMIRVRAGISYALTAAMNEGHCGLPTDELVPLAERLLEVSADLVRTALDLDPSLPIIMCDARSRESAKEVLITLIEHVLTVADEPVSR